MHHWLSSDRRACPPRSQVSLSSCRLDLGPVPLSLLPCPVSLRPRLPCSDPWLPDIPYSPLYPVPVTVPADRLIDPPATATGTLLLAPSCPFLPNPFISLLNPEPFTLPGSLSPRPPRVLVHRRVRPQVPVYLLWTHQPPTWCPQLLFEGPLQESSSSARFHSESGATRPGSGATSTSCRRLCRSSCS